LRAVVLESVILSAFGAVLLGSLLFHVKIVYALLVGLCLFEGYALARSFSWREVLSMCWRGVKTTRGLLLLFVLIGLLTALWRASGTIPVIVSYASNLIHPQSFILVAFLLNAAMSLLTGSALGTAATMGVICATMAQTMGINPAWVGGAILSGSYFGNRLSPISSMALLTANITGTEIYSNVRNMLRTSWFPLLLSCAVYLVVGFCFSGELGEVALSSAKSVRELFAQEFSLSLWGVLPAILMVVLSMLRVKSSRVLLSSALCALVIALLVEYRDVASLWEFLVYGFHSQMPDLSKMINGGGLLSMVNVFLIVFIAGCFGGIFKGTELLSPLKKCVCFLEKSTNSFVAMLVASIVAACVSCNQTLTIILTNQLTSSAERSPEHQALDLYDTAVTVIALVPWSVATSIVLVAAQASSISVCCACFLYLLPLSRLFTCRHKTQK
jgi:NhaC family Na+:H+ antiporter